MSTVKKRLAGTVSMEEIYLKSEQINGMTILQVIEKGIKTHEKLLKVVNGGEVRKRFKDGLKTLKVYKSMVKSGEELYDRNHRALGLLVATSLWYWEGE